MADTISCPWCDRGPMVSGVIAGRSPGVKFKESTDVTGDLFGITITDGFFNHSAPALRCEGCGTVVVPPRA